MKKLAVIAIGGNSLIKSKNHQTVQDQYEACKETCRHIAGMVEQGYNVIVTHGNGPQVGFILRRSEIASGELHEVPLDSCGADSQGAIGYMIQMALGNEFKHRSVDKTVVTVVTQVLVDQEDQAFKNPSKPIGSFMGRDEADKRVREEGWAVKEDAGRGFRRVVASPLPKEVIEKSAIRTLIERDFVVVGVGGGGIPVVRDEKGDLKGVEAVIDKDFASSLLAQEVGADLFLISTAVEKVALNYNTPQQVDLASLTLEEAKKYYAEGHFAAGSMGPKIKAIIEYLEKGGKTALITCPEKLEEALQGKTGTRITRD